jgi:hypothetical protein
MICPPFSVSETTYDLQKLDLEDQVAVRGNLAAYGTAAIGQV